MTIVEVLCGGIASGKSTYAKARADEGWIIVNDDAIVQALHAGNYLLYKEKLKPLYKSVEDHIFHTAIAMNLNVIVDRGINNSICSRKRWIALARSLDVGIGARLFPMWSPEEHARRRTMYDNRGHNFDFWLKVAQQHFKDWESPTLEEGFDYVETYKWEK